MSNFHSSQEIEHYQCPRKPSYVSLINLNSSLEIINILIFILIFYLFFKNKFIYLLLFLAALGLRCCARAFSSCGERGLLFVAVSGLLIAVTSLVVEHGL